MAFVEIDKKAYPIRQWALYGPPAAGKSTFATQMRGPLLTVDADHRFTEVARHALSKVFNLSKDPADNVNVERIAALLRESMAGSGVQTVVIDSLTAILSPLVTQAVLDNEAGRNKNRVAGFKPKAMAMRLIQDVITGWGVDTLWIYHTRAGLDSQAVNRETTSITTLELARLRRSLNMTLKVVQDGKGRGIFVEWARRGRSGITLYDGSGHWAGMPERIEKEVYDGLSEADMEALASQTPTSFASVEAAIGWGWEAGCFHDAAHAKNAYEELKRTAQPKTAAAMWAAWIEEVGNRVMLADAKKQLANAR